jgi:hypothetical protein
MCLVPTAGPLSDLPPPFTSPVDDSFHVVVNARRSRPHSEETSLSDGIREWLVPSASAADANPPTQDEIKLLREALATFYGMDRDFEKSEKLLTKAIDAWQRQPPDEKAGLYRVRGDCYMVGNSENAFLFVLIQNHAKSYLPFARRGF